MSLPKISQKSHGLTSHGSKATMIIMKKFLRVGLTSRNLILCFIAQVFVIDPAVANRAANDAELKSAYCAQRLKTNIPRMESIEKVLSTHVNNPLALEQAEKLKLKIERSKIDQRRLLSYLTTKTKEVDVTGLLLAIKSADDDERSFDICESKCTNSKSDWEKYSACQASCQLQLGNPDKRLLTCDTVDWLPF